MANLFFKIVSLVVLATIIENGIRISSAGLLPLPSILSFGRDSGEQEEKLDLIDKFLLDVLPTFIGQAPNNENGTKSVFKNYAMQDKSNDDAYRMSGIELIERSGFKYECYDAIADDGYITTVTRLINPEADRRQLRWPPVLLEHGGTIDPTAYMVASSIQHHPEPWPRTPKDGPMTSWNRSLAFVLANNGFDVWLAETRGSNDKNKRHVKKKAFESALTGANAFKNMSMGETVHELLNSWNFWSFSQDDIIAHELKSHIDLVLRETKSKKLSVMTFSLSTPTSLAFLSLRPDYAEKIQGFISMAPIISGEGANGYLKVVMQALCPLVPNHVGTLVFTDTIFSQPMRELLVFISRPKNIRYSLIKSIISIMMGPSAKYETLLELNILGHMLRQLSFKEAKQLCQQMKSNKLQKFDYGAIKNKLIYNSTEPPVYDLTKLRLKDWIIVAAPNDKLSTPQVVDKLIEMTNPKPIARIEAPGFNHLDLIAGVENDKYVNLPILRYLQSVSSSAGDEQDYMEASASRQLDVKSFLPPELYPERLSEHTQHLTKQFNNFTRNINTEEILGSMQENLFKLFPSFGDFLSKRSRMDGRESEDKY